MSKIKVKPEVISDTEKNGENDDGKESPEVFQVLAILKKTGKMMTVKNRKMMRPSMEERQ